MYKKTMTMNARYKAEKEPIELLLGMGGAVQYLEHALKDDVNYSVWVKTKTGNRQITIPIEAVRLIQSKKPADAVIESIKRQLAGESSAVPIPIKESGGRTVNIRRWFLRMLGIRR
ncbi:hypothetical protein GJR95_16160 [Spirosoma endbachense]|uniref:Uncharacterized protein n=2 Tax=Spirosoma endbachense TaxID=2666025 RepID=A0A6P1VXM5_9BACT|nr:hypothetical protein GJR95_16160 [Spirosoma endbachense]